MSISLDCWKIIIEFLNKRARLNTVLTCKEISRISEDIPIWDTIVLYQTTKITNDQFKLFRKLYLKFSGSLLKSESWDTKIKMFDFSRIIYLYAPSCYLKELPDLPNAETITCFGNRLEKVGNMSKVKNLNLSNNIYLSELTSIPLVRILSLAHTSVKINLGDCHHLIKYEL